MCVVFSIIEHVYWYLRVTLSSMLVGKSSYVSFLRPSISRTHFTISFLEWDEWPFLRGSRSLSLPSLHSLMMWLHSIFLFELIIISLYMFIISPSSSLLLSIHPLRFTSLLFSYSGLFQFWYFLCIILTYLFISLVFFICVIMAIIFTLGTLKSMAH